METAHRRAARAALAVLAAAAVAGAVLAGVASGDTRTQKKSANAAPTFHGTLVTVAKTSVGLEGLTADRDGNLYSPGRGADPCPILRVPASGGTPQVAGTIPAPCNPTGLAFDASGRLYVADEADIYVLTPSTAAPPAATVFATGVPGANGVAFDERGNLWVSDGGTGQGRV